MKVKEVIKMTEDDGWYLARTRGSHRQYKHASKVGLVTVPGQTTQRRLGARELNSVLKQAGLKK
jgi:predicted RNA binding protein YcfA (HicA-like mRNA interferase family)